MPVRLGWYARRIGKILYVVGLMYALGYGAIVLLPLHLKFWVGLVSLPPMKLLTVAVSSALLLPVLDWMDGRLRLVPFSILEWSVFRRNVNFVPMDYVWLRVPFLVLLYFNLPGLAWVEEMVFRHDWVIHATSGWGDALWRSALFGVLHVAGGAKLRTALPLSVGGLWFSWQYMTGGIEAATMAHLAMNTTGLTLMLLGWARTGENPFTK